MLKFYIQDAYANFDQCLNKVDHNGYDVCKYIPKVADNW
jgi:hypothetical protein